MALTVTNESIEALGRLKSRIEELNEELKTGSKNLMNVYDENAERLGAHSKKIMALIENLGAMAGEDESVKQLALRLRMDMLVRQRAIEENRYHTR